MSLQQLDFYFAGQTRQLEKAERKARGRRAKKTKALDLDTAGEDSFYAAVRDATTKKKRARAEAYEPKKMMTGAEPEVRGNQPRNASVKILKNRGLVRRHMLKESTASRKLKYGRHMCQLSIPLAYPPCDAFVY